MTVADSSFKRLNYIEITDIVSFCFLFLLDSKLTGRGKIILIYHIWESKPVQIIIKSILNH